MREARTFWPFSLYLYCRTYHWVVHLTYKIYLRGQSWPLFYWCIKLMKGLYMSLTMGKMNALYIHGKHSFAEIARIDGRSPTTIYHLLKDSGAEIRNRSEANELFPDSVFMALYNLGLSCSQIGVLLDIHPTTIIKRLKIKNFQLRSKRVAAAIRYSDEEFKRFFENEQFTTDLLFLKLGTGRLLESIIDE